MLGLLEATGRFAKLQQGVLDFFRNFELVFCVEIIMFFLLIFFVSKVLRDNDATKLMVLYWVMLVAGGVLHVLDSEILTTQFYLLYVILLSSVMLIFFSVEVKKYFWDVHKSKNLTVDKETGAKELRTAADTDRCITNIVKALQNMSKNNIGALIVLSHGNLPRQVLESGTDVDAEISTQLIEGIFFPKAPLHDGAMVIRGYKIQAAGCFLPLTQKTSYPKEYGTRHRAAIGITETANVISLVVSEETGIISIIDAGEVKRYADTDMLVEKLTKFYKEEASVDKKRIGGGK